MIISRSNDAMLEYAIKDCTEAIQANPLGHKSEQYLALARACQAELNRRNRLRVWRKEVKPNYDKLTYPLKSRKWVYSTVSNLAAVRSAILNLGLLKIYP